jgi:putative SOS response-associated peptidase YedK
MALAGLWENWRSPAGEWMRSFAIITTTPNELCAELHNRMPVVLKPEAWPTWLGEQPAELPQLKSLLAPYPSDEMICWPVSARVGNVKNNDPSLIERSPRRDTSARPRRGAQEFGTIGDRCCWLRTIPFPPR